jgi:hypothetical protein
MVRMKSRMFAAGAACVLGVAGIAGGVAAAEAG